MVAGLPGNQLAVFKAQPVTLMPTVRLAREPGQRAAMLRNVPAAFKLRLAGARRAGAGGSITNSHRVPSLALRRRLLDVPPPEAPAEQIQETIPPCRSERCPCCGGAMVLRRIRVPSHPDRRATPWSDSASCHLRHRFARRSGATPRDAPASRCFCVSAQA